MAKARALDKRRKSIKNIRKITRTMELIATARFAKAMDRASAASAYTERITRLVRDLAESGLEVRHPLLEGRDATDNATLLVLTGNRGLCGGYNSSVARAALTRWREIHEQFAASRIEISGKRGIRAFKYRKIEADEKFTDFEDKPAFRAVELIANRYLNDYTVGKLDRLDVAYTKFESVSRQFSTVETLLPLGSLTGVNSQDEDGNSSGEANRGESIYEFVPTAESILEEVVPASFRVKLFKCFLDAAVSEQIARRIAMKSATENADELIKQLSRTYNRARQGQITSEILEVIGGAEALKG
jgi:F-type H+-transporting ATPase subunit gamma